MFTKIPFEQRQRKKYLSAIRTFDDPVLKEKCQALINTDSMSFIEMMKNVLKWSENGVGLAAPQIGITKRVCVIWHERHLMKVMINPIYYEKSEDFEEGLEGCLSYPGITRMIKRNKSIRVIYSVYNYNTTKLEDQPIEYFEGMEARIIQHEMDHLDGVCQVGMQ